MSRIRYVDDRPAPGSVVVGLALGALAGFAIGVVVAQKAGGIPGVMRRVRMGLDALEETVAQGDTFADDGETGYGEDDFAHPEDAGDEFDATDATLEEQVLDAFEEDAILRERALEIGAVGKGVIELGGSVRTEAEAARAMGIARGVEGVSSVVSRIEVQGIGKRE